MIKKRTHELLNGGQGLCTSRRRRATSRNKRRIHGAGAVCHMDTRCAAVLLHRRRIRGAGASYDMCTRCAVVLLFRDPTEVNYSRLITVSGHASAAHHGRTGGAIGSPRGSHPRDHFLGPEMGKGPPGTEN